MLHNRGLLGMLENFQPRRAAPKVASSANECPHAYPRADRGTGHLQGLDTSEDRSQPLWTDGRDRHASTV